MSHLNSSLGGLEFSIDTDGKGQYRVSGDSKWTPFLSGNEEVIGYASYMDRQSAITKTYVDIFTATKDVDVTLYVIAQGTLSTSTSASKTAGYSLNGNDIATLTFTGIGTAHLSKTTMSLKSGDVLRIWLCNGATAGATQVAGILTTDNSMHSTVDSENVTIATNTVQLYNSTQANIINISNNNLKDSKLLYLTFLSANTGDILTNLTWSGCTIDEVLKNEVHSGVQHYIVKITCNSNSISLKADYAYNRNRSCSVTILVV